MPLSVGVPNQVNFVDHIIHRNYKRFKVQPGGDNDPKAFTFRVLLVPPFLSLASSAFITVSICRESSSSLSFTNRCFSTSFLKSKKDDEKSFLVYSYDLNPFHITGCACLYVARERQRNLTVSDSIAYAWSAIPRCLQSHAAGVSQNCPILYTVSHLNQARDLLWPSTDMWMWWQIWQMQSHNPIGKSKKATRVECRIHINNYEQWQSSIRIDIQAYLNGESLDHPHTDHPHTCEDELIYVWTIRLNAASCHGDKLLVEILSEDLKRDDLVWDSPTNGSHHSRYTQKRDEEVKNFRTRGDLGWLQWHLSLRKHTVGESYGSYQTSANFNSFKIQLRTILSMASENPIFLNAILKASEARAFHARYDMIRQTLMDKHQYSPHTAFFGELVDAKCSIQKWQVWLVQRLLLVLCTWLNPSLYSESMESWTWICGKYTYIIPAVRKNRKKWDSCYVRRSSLTLETRYWTHSQPSRLSFRKPAKVEIGASSGGWQNTRVSEFYTTVTPSCVVRNIVLKENPSLNGSNRVHLKMWFQWVIIVRSSRSATATFWGLVEWSQTAFPSCGGVFGGWFDLSDHWEDKRETNRQRFDIDSGAAPGNKTVQRLKSENDAIVRSWKWLELWAKRWDELAGPGQSTT